MQATTLSLLPLVFACHSAPETAPQVDTSRAHRSFELVYRAAVEEVPEDAEQVRLWIPVPVDTNDQEITGVRVSGTSGNLPFEIEPERFASGEPFEGERKGLRFWVRDIENGLGRSLAVETAGQPVELEMRFDVTRYETTSGGSATQAELERHLEADSMVPLDGQVARVAGTIETPDDGFEAARTLYEHTLERMSYKKPHGAPWGRGDAEWACDSRFGNCTDFHSYFMGLARSKGIPARFVMGFPVPAGDEEVAQIGGYHCWAYFWDDDKGWVPVDISEADKNPDKAEYFFGTLDPDRVTMTGGRDLVLDPAPQAGPLNFFVYPYAEVDGKPWEHVSRSFQRIKK